MTNCNQLFKTIFSWKISIYQYAFPKQQTTLVRTFVGQKNLTLHAVSHLTNRSHTNENSKLSRKNFHHMQLRNGSNSFTWISYVSCYIPLIKIQTFTFF